ncbi:hypothetical protein B0H16DRAFT_1890682 [Mycena metata]|uniref:Uncharacterized protein n=1 Tax=Mycena metata TaxID=1033252 RepID=A0AAD7IFI2_9AGAR|nr:hypothetical protein B0H16DRAFT_1890682 [Mycena metata]
MDHGSRFLWMYNYDLFVILMRLAPFLNRGPPLPHKRPPASLRDPNCLPSVRRGCIVPWYVARIAHHANDVLLYRYPLAIAYGQPTISALVVLIDIFWLVPTYMCAMASVARFSYPILIPSHPSCDILPPDRLLPISISFAGAKRLPVECPKNPTDTQCTLTPSTAYNIPSSRHVSVSAAMMDVLSPAVRDSASRNQAFLPPSLPPSRARLPSYTSRTRPLAFLPPAYIRIRLQFKPPTALFCFSHKPSPSLPSQNPNRTSSAFRVPS